MDDDDDIYSHMECTKGRRMKDDGDEDDGDEARMATSLKQHGVFQNKVDTLFQHHQQGSGHCLHPGIVTWRIIPW